MSGAEYIASLRVWEEKAPYSRTCCRYCDRVMLTFDLITHVYEEHPQKVQEDPYALATQDAHLHRLG